jgi:hypothetical protein
MTINDDSQEHLSKSEANSSHNKTPERQAQPPTQRKRKKKTASPPNKHSTEKSAEKSKSTNVTGIYYGIAPEQIIDDLVLAVDPLGQAISRVCDMTWHLEHLKIVETDDVSFHHSQMLHTASTNSENIRIFKKLFLISNFVRGRGRSGIPRVTTMKVEHRAGLSIVKFCDSHEVLIKQMINDSKLTAQYIATLSLGHARVIKKLFRNYMTLPLDSSEFVVPKPFMVALRKHMRSLLISKGAARQHPVIPSRIFQLRWNHYYETLEEFERHFPQIAAFVERANADRFYGKNAKTVRRLERQLGGIAPSTVPFPAAIEHYGLSELFQKHAIKDNNQVVRYLLFVQYCAKCIVHILTLMRDNEAVLLDENCVEPAIGWNEEAIYVLGSATKLTGTAAPIRWITVPEILYPLQVLLKLRDMVHPHLPKRLQGTAHLLLGLGWLPMRGGRETTRLLSNVSDDVFDKYLPEILITEEDVSELELIDFLRDWRADPQFRVGTPWTITSHQFRRSMAVYFAQHKSMTLPGLKRALTHLTMAMSLHYQKGCSAGIYKMEQDNPALVKEIRDAALDVSNAIYVRDVLCTEERLLGVEGRVVQAKKDNPTFVLRESQQELMRLKKKGLLACVETPIGLCVSNSPCDKRAHGNFTTCDGCVHSIIKLSKVDSTIQSMELDLLELDPSSMEYRMDLQNLDDMKAVRDRLIVKSLD